MVNILWSLLIIIGIAYSFVSGQITNINDYILKIGSSTLELLMITIPLLIMWMGLLNIADKTGLLAMLSKKIRIILKPLFPKIKNNKALDYIASNVIANMFGLGSAATPFGLKAMEELQKENNNKEIASSSMITFLVLNTSGVTIIPTTVISLRMMYGSINPSQIIITSLIATIIASTIGLLIDYVIRRINNDN